MARRRSHLAVVVLFVACELAFVGFAPGEETPPLPSEPAALNAPPTAAPAISTSTPVPRPQGNIARIWANEPTLVRLARDHFGDDFCDDDAKFFTAVAANDWADFRPKADTSFDANDPGSWSEAPKLKANRIAWTCTDPSAVKLIPKRGIWLRGAAIEGKIDLYRAEVPFSLTFYDCLLDGGLTVEHATLQELDIRNCCSGQLNGHGVEVRENVYLNNSCIYGGVNFVDSQILGDFDYSGGTASQGMPADDHSKPGIALNFHDAKIGGDIRLADEFRAWGQVRMLGTQIGRGLICSNGRFSGAGETAIDAQRARVGASVMMRGNFEASGGVDLRRSRIGGDLDCDGGRFLAAEVDALNADLVDVGDQVHFGDGFHAEGEVRMINSSVVGDVDCDNGHFLHPDGDALSFDCTEIGRSLRLGLDSDATKDEDSDLPAGFMARGTVRLCGTKIQQEILASGGRFETPRGNAILASNLRVESRVEFIAVDVKGTANFFSAEIGHEFDCRGSHFDASQAPDRMAFLGNGMHVHGHLYCNQLPAGNEQYDFRVDGLMSLAFAKVGMHWDLQGATLSNPGGDALDASDCRVGGYVNIDSVAIVGRASFSRAKIDGMWVLVNSVRPEQAHFDLRFAHIWVIKDEKLGDWPPAGQIQLEGLVYDHFDDDSPLSVEDRLQWLRRQYALSGTTTGHAIPVSDAGNITARQRPRSVITGARFVDHDPRQSGVRPVGYESSSADLSSATDPAVQMAAPATPLNSASEPADELNQMTQSQSDSSGSEGDAVALPLADEADEAGSAVNAAESVDPPDPARRRYLTQPYTQLAAVYRGIGQDEQANAVLVARAQRIGELSPLLSAQGLWYRYLGRLIGYGYEPFRAIKIGVTIVIVGSFVFAVGARRNLMAETKLAEQVLSQENEPRLVSATYPRFNPLIYSLDVFLPFVDLQQICYWLPGERLGGPRASRNCLLHIGRWKLKWGGVLRTYFWFQTLAGWTLCTLLAAAVTGIVES